MLKPSAAAPGAAAEVALGDRILFDLDARRVGRTLERLCSPFGMTASICIRRPEPDSDHVPDSHLVESEAELRASVAGT
jgi:hypothetical protein